MPDPEKTPHDTLRESIKEIMSGTLPHDFREALLVEAAETFAAEQAKHFQIQITTLSLNNTRLKGKIEEHEDELKAVQALSELE